MVRPRRFRRVAYLPDITYFKPAGIPLRALEEVILSVEEVEAVRLKDIEDLEQEQAAVKMNISRPTYQRVLESARKKIADALLHGKAIRIQGGSYVIYPLRYGCINGHQWEVPFDSARILEPHACPICNLPGTLLAEVPLPSAGRRGRGRQMRRGMGWRNRPI